MRKTLPEAHASPETTPQIEELFRQILNLATVGRLPIQGLSVEDDGGEIALQVNVNGVDYTLARKTAGLVEGEVSLSPREREIVRLVARGLANKTIAAVLDVSPWTVATHVRHVFAKLKVNSRAEMVARALEKGLLKAER